MYTGIKMQTGGRPMNAISCTKVHIKVSSIRNHPDRARRTHPVLSNENGDVNVSKQQPMATKSSFSETPPFIKAIVGGLTNLVNATANVSAGGSSDKEVVNDSDLDLVQEVICLEDLKKGISKDFTESGYLWSGEISEELYDADCEFTDPTLSFKGLDTFKRNITSLKPWVDMMLASRDIVLKSCELREDLGVVRASWRMVGDIRLPWSPRIDLNGQTDFVYDSKKGNRIVKYLESWDVSAGRALLQIFIPGPRRIDDQT